jgi:hypothetical protein
MPLARRFAFLTVGCPENEGARNRRAVACSFLGLVYMTCGAWPPCHKVGSLVHVRGDFTRDASRARVGGSAFKKRSISRAVDMPCSSCDHRALSPFGPPDGVRRCSLEGSTSRLSLSATSPSESARSWWCRRSCPLLAAVGGVQPHGSWHPSTIIRLQGFSSHSPVATFGRWSSTRMTTGLVVERSEPGCSLPLPSASRMFIIRAGEEGEPSGSFAFHMGWRSASSSSIWGRRAPTGLAEEANSGYAGPAVCGAVSCRVSGSPAWVALVPPPALPPAAGAERGCPSTVRATVALRAGWPHPRLLLRHRSHREVVQDVVRRGGGDSVLGWSCPHSCSEDGSEDLFVCAGAAAAHRCSGGRCHWWG